MSVYIEVHILKQTFDSSSMVYLANNRNIWNWELENQLCLSLVMMDEEMLALTAD